MKIQSYTYPKSSFLSTEKDMNIIVDHIMKNDRLKKMLFYTSRDCLSKPKLTEEETVNLFGKQIKIVPKLQVDAEILNYLYIYFNNFIPNPTNPEFRDNLISFEIICHYSQWHLYDFALRPYKIAAEIDSMFDKKYLSGIGRLEFVGATIVSYNEDEFAGLCLQYRAIHGEEDKKHALNPEENKELIKNFDAIFND